MTPEMKYTIQKIALDPRTVASAAAKRGVPTGYLKALAQSRAEKARLGGGGKPIAVQQRNNASAWNADTQKLESGVGERYHASWAKNKEANETDALGDRIVSDLIKGAQSNPRTGEIQIDRAGAETKLASYGVTPLDLAHMVGTLQALDEAGFSKKEAAEYLNVGEDAIDAVLVASSD